jgi:hypothetical protein
LQRSGSFEENLFRINENHTALLLLQFIGVDIRVKTSRI